MSTYEYTDDDGDNLEIVPSDVRPAILVHATSKAGALITARVSNEDAPALALAILEAAGIRSEGDTLDHSYESHLIEGAKALRAAINIHSKQAEREAEDAKVREWRAAFPAQDTHEGVRWRELSESTKDRMRHQYRAAREFFQGES